MIEDPYIAHALNSLEKFQSVSSHNQNTANLIRERCPLTLLENLGYLAGSYHDAGKYQTAFAEYIKKAILNPGSVRPGSVTHSSSGAFLVEDMAPKTIFSAMLQEVIFSHHGLCDCYSLETGAVLSERRREDEHELGEVERRFYQYADRSKLLDFCGHAQADVKEMTRGILEFVRSGGETQVYGNRDFYLGMYERLLMSLLIDGDRIDTASYMLGRVPEKRMTENELEVLWGRCSDSLEIYLQNFKGKGQLNECRSLISDMCKAAAEKADHLYRLTVPTGTGKTLASLRFALNHGKKYKKQHIFYIAPYQSIIDQNADTIREAIGDPELVLEHHSNMIHETEEENSRYQLLTENYSCPVIVTTAVQLLNTLFSSTKSCVRRMHSLCNSIIIFDEIQSVPVRTIKLFNLAVNFLTQFCDSTVVLCSATQPLLDRISENRILPPVDMVSSIDNYLPVLKRTRLVDQTSGPQGWGIEELSNFVSGIFPEKRQILVVVNTKSCAAALYEALKQRNEMKDCLLFHLSTNMCPEHRKEILKEVDTSLREGKPVICVSTQLIEAGVNISFCSVVRSLAGLDSIIQAAGRCNRHGESETGDVYIVRMTKEAENVSRLYDIRQAQEIMETVLYQYRIQPEKFGNSLDSTQSIELYYQLYLNRRLQEMEYPVNLTGIQTTLLQLLSSNEKIWRSFHDPAKKKPWLRQAFKTAGDKFEVIPEDGKVDVVVEYDQKAKDLLDELQTPYLSLTDQRRLIARLQPYGVGISEQMRQKLRDAIHGILGGTILVLSENYYDKEIGVSEKPTGMEYLGF